jgi:hypothetical protein
VAVLPLIACGLLSLTGDARAVSLISPRDAMAPRLQAWADAAAVPTTKAAVVVLPEGCRQENAEACTVLGPAPTLYFPDLEYLFRGQGSDVEREAVHLNFLHELGHIYDFTTARHPYRARFLRIMRLPLVGSAAALRRRARPAGWMQAGQAPADELFAMAYSYCAAGLDFRRCSG